MSITVPLGRVEISHILYQPEVLGLTERRFSFRYFKPSGYLIQPDGYKIFSYPKPIDFFNSFSNQMWGYFIKCGTRVFCHIQFHLTENLSDWAGITANGALPPSPVNVGVIVANGKTGSNNSIYLFATGKLSQGGGGGMIAGDYTFDFDYETN